MVEWAFSFYNGIAGCDSQRNLRPVGHLRSGSVVTGILAALAGTYFGWSGLFDGPPYGIGMLAAGIILAIMVVPIISSITREVMTAVPQQQREAVLALGATRWEMIRTGVLRNARAGILGGVILGLGRALGETMAVTMVIGNRPEIAKSLFAPGYTMASVIANEFSEATGDVYLSALVEVGLALFIVTIIVNILAQISGLDSNSRKSGEGQCLNTALR